MKFTVRRETTVVTEYQVELTKDMLKLLAKQLNADQGSIIVSSGKPREFCREIETSGLEYALFDAINCRCIGEKNEYFKDGEEYFFDF